MIARGYGGGLVERILSPKLVCRVAIEPDQADTDPCAESLVRALWMCSLPRSGECVRGPFEWTGGWSRLSLASRATGPTRLVPTVGHGHNLLVLRCRDVVDEALATAWCAWFGHGQEWPSAGRAQPSRAAEPGQQLQARPGAARVASRTSRAPG